MTLKDLILKVTSVGYQITSTQIPVVDAMWQELDVDLEIVQDVDGKYYAQMTKV